MMIPYRALTATILVASLAVLSACDTADPTFVAIDNDYPQVADGGDPSQRVVIYKTWWVETLSPDPVAPGESSAEFRTTPSHGVAVVLLAPGWDPASGVPPTTLIVVKSKEVLEVTRGNTLHIKVSDDTFGGSCAAHQPLPQEDVDFVTDRIFPGEFANVVYDARTCTSTPAVPKP